MVYLHPVRPELLPRRMPGLPVAAAVLAVVFTAGLAIGVLATLIIGGA